MENTPRPPYQRNRRAGRITPLEEPRQEVVQPVQQEAYAPRPAVPQQPVYPPPQPISRQQVYSYQQPAAPVQQPAMPRQQVNVPPPQTGTPRQGQLSTLHAPQHPAPQQPRPQAARGFTAAERPRAEIRGPIVSDNEPVHRQALLPERRQPPRKDREGTAQAKAQKLPGSITTLLSLMLIAVMALVAANFLMQAYLKRAADERLAAHNAILYNYHVTENDDGSYRITWQDLIERYAKEYNLQPAFVAAVIRTESSFRTNAESSVGARGLMQMMPDTAQWVAGKLDERYDFDDLYEAETSIRYGCWYLNYLSELFRGDPVLVSAAYHAGQGEVWGWLGDPAISPDGATVPMENIPISNTRTYAGRVTQAYGIYQTLLYPENTFDAAQGSVPADGNTPRSARTVR